MMLHLRQPTCNRYFHFMATLKCGWSRQGAFINYTSAELVHYSTIVHSHNHLFHCVHWEEYALPLNLVCKFLLNHRLVHDNNSPCGYNSATENRSGLPNTPSPAPTFSFLLHRAEIMNAYCLPTVTTEVSYSWCIRVLYLHISAVVVSTCPNQILTMQSAASTWHSHYDQSVLNHK